MLAIWTSSQAFETLVVGPPSTWVLRNDFEIRVVARRAGCGERRGAVAAGNNSVRRSNDAKHLSGGEEVVDISSILVGDPKGAIAVEYEAFSVS